MDKQDFDGDECMFMPAMDKYMEQMMYPFSPHFNLLLMDKPFEISRNPAWTDSVVASLSEKFARESRELRGY